MVSRRFLSVITLIALLVSSVSITLVSNAGDPGNPKPMDTTGELSRSPATVKRWRPATILAEVRGPHSDVQLDITIKIELWGPVCDPNCPSREWVRRKPMVPAGNPGWYIAGVPGLPAREGPLGRTVESRVDYALIVDGVEKDQGGYSVIKQDYTQDLKPFVLFADTRTNRTFPPGMVVNSGEQYDDGIIVALDDREITDVSLQYSVDWGSWREAPADPHPWTDAFDNLVSEITDFLDSLPNQFDFIDGRPQRSFVAEKPRIPAQNAGVSVRTIPLALDSSNQQRKGPMGLYYVTKGDSQTRVLILDPHPELWLLERSFKKFVSSLMAHIDYSLPSDYGSRLSSLKSRAEGLFSVNLTRFHHWGGLSSSYNIEVRNPRDDVAGRLRKLEEGGFEPSVIVLSDLWWGYENVDYVNWDLNDIDAGNGQKLLQKLVSYMKENHAGLLATHGTLSDWIVWKSCQESGHIKVGTRGHVGDMWGDLNPMEERSVAALLGMPHLSLFEIVRDKVAESLCDSEDPRAQIAGQAIGSLPLHIPRIPFDGAMNSLEENHRILANVPSNFQIPVESVYKDFGFDSYTQLGWQLAIPRSWGIAASEAANESLATFRRFSSKASSFAEQFSNSQLPKTIRRHLDNGSGWGFHRLYDGLTSAAFGNGTADIHLRNLPLDISERREEVNTSIDELLKMIPLKLIAASQRGRAGIVTYDKYFDPKGYRSVYFSMEVEASNTSVGATLLRNSVEWLKGWEYQDLTTLLRDKIRLQKKSAQRFRSLAPAKTLSALSTISGENGSAAITIPGQEDEMRVVIAHPTTDTLDVISVQGGELVGSPETEENVTLLTLQVPVGEESTISVRPNSDLSINPIYAEAYERNTPPTASFTVTPNEGNTTTAFKVDASSSSDLEDSSADLEVRWDWEDDGTWDTAWNTSKTAQHQYTTPGTYTVRLEVRDSGGLMNQTTKQVLVNETTEGGEKGEGTTGGLLGSIFLWILLPLIVFIVLGVVVGVLIRRRRSKEEEGIPSEGVEKEPPLPPPPGTS